MPLVFEEQVVHFPEPALTSGALGGTGAEQQSHGASRVFTSRALQVSVFDHRDRSGARPDKVEFIRVHSTPPRADACLRVIARRLNGIARRYRICDRVDASPARAESQDSLAILERRVDRQDPETSGAVFLGELDVVVAQPCRVIRRNGAIRTAYQTT